MLLLVNFTRVADADADADSDADANAVQCSEL